MGKTHDCARQALGWNQDKAREVEEATSGAICVLQVCPRNDPASGFDLEATSKAKALAAFADFKRPLIVESTGLVIDGTEGFPGALTKQVMVLYLDHAQFVAAMTNRAARMVTVFVHYDGMDFTVFSADTRRSLPPDSPPNE